MSTPRAEQLPSGSWRVRIAVNGQHYSITKPTRGEAEAEAMAIKAGVKQAAAPQANITLAGAIDRYIANYKAVLSAATIRGYTSIRKNRFQALMPQSLRTITRDQWQAAIDRESKQLAPKTVKNVWGLMTAVMTDSGIQKPAVKLPSKIPNEHEFLTAEEIPVFLAAIEGKPVEIPALLALHSLRRSEIMDLTWKDIDLKRGLLHVRGAAVFNEQHKLVHQKTNKNETSNRDVPIMIPRLAELLADAPRTSDYVVTCHPNTICERVNRVCAAADLPQVGTHGLRHSFASLAKHLKMPEETCMELGGWSDYVTMHKIYTHISEKDRTEEIASMRNFYKNLP